MRTTYVSPLRHLPAHVGSMRHVELHMPVLHAEESQSPCQAPATLRRSGGTRSGATTSWSSRPGTLSSSRWAGASHAWVLLGKEIPDMLRPAQVGAAGSACA
jgi:hypothetical protein